MKITKNGDKIVDTVMSSMHPEIDIDMKTNYLLCRSTNKKEKFLSKLVLKTRDDEGKLNHSFAQVLKHKHKRNNFLFVWRKGTVRRRLGRLKIEHLSSYSSSCRRFRSFFSGTTVPKAIVHNAPQKLITFTPPKYIKGLILNYKKGGFPENYRFENFSEKLKRLVGLIINYFDEIDVISNRPGKSLLGYPTKTAVKFSSALLENMESKHRNSPNFYRHIERAMSNGFYMILPHSSQEKDGLPSLGTRRRLAEKRQLVLALRQEPKELTMTYSDRVDCKLARLPFRLKSATTTDEFFRNLVRNVNMSSHKLEGLYLFDDTISSSNFRQLLWVSVPNVYEVLRYGLDRKKSDVFLAGGIAGAFVKAPERGEKEVVLLCEVKSDQYNDEEALQTCSREMLITDSFGATLVYDEEKCLSKGLTTQLVARGLVKIRYLVEIKFN